MPSLVFDARSHDLGGFSVGRVLPFVKHRMVGPFVFLDHIGPAAFAPGDGINVRPHPHIGLSTVTYLFDGEIMHRDSLGYHEAIVPGEVNWMTAGSGIVHSERTAPETRASGQTMHGMQAWVGLPEADEETDPAFTHYGVGDLTTVAENGLWMRLVAGDAYGLSNAVKTHSPLFYVHAELEAGGRMALPTNHAERAAFVARGAVSVGGHVVKAGQMIVFDRADSDDIMAEADATVMLLGGYPIGPRFMEWNFVHSSKERIEDAKAAWRAGLMKLPVGDDTEWIPLPGEG